MQGRRAISENKIELHSRATNQESWIANKEHKKRNANEEHKSRQEVQGGDAYRENTIRAHIRNTHWGNNVGQQIRWFFGACPASSLRRTFAAEPPAKQTSRTASGGWGRGALGSEAHCPALL